MHTRQRTTAPGLLDQPVLDLFHLDLEKGLYILLAIVATVACFANLGARGQSHDECVHFLYSREFYIGEGFEHDPWRHGPFLYHINALIYFLFGADDFTARISTAAFGVLLVLLPSFLRKELGRAGALMASVLTLISPSTLYYARYIRNDIYMMVWAMGMAIALFRYLDSRQPRWLYLGALAATMALCSKETAYISGFIGLTFLGMAFMRQVLSPRAVRAATILGAMCLLLLALVLIGLDLSRPSQAPDPAADPTAKWIEYLVLLAGILLALLFSSALIRRDETLQPGLRLIAAYLIAIAALLAFCVGVGGLAWLAFIQLPAGVIAPWLFLTLQVLLAGLGAGAGGYAWWRLLQRARQRGWLPARFDRRTLFTTLALAVVPFVLLYTTFFTNPKGLATGTVGAITYWLAQQAVKRGSQPWFYYLMLVALYDFLPLGLSALATACYVLTTRHPPPATRHDPSSTLFVAYCVYWMLSAWLLYSWAGEKMPWMVLHIVQPMLLLSGRFLGDLLRGLDWRKIGRIRERPGWAATWRAVFLSAVAVLALLTARFAYMASYIHYDTAKEFLVYAHGTPDLKRTVNELKAISRHLYGDESAIRFAYTADAAWPFECYFADFPNRVFIGSEPNRANTDVPVLVVGNDEIAKTEPFLGQRYYRFDRKYLWFPHQDYYMNLSLAVPPEEKRVPGKNYFFLDMRDPARRRAFWNVLFYRKYEQSLADWEPSNPGKFALYVRKDVAAQVWDLRSAPTDAE